MDNRETIVAVQKNGDGDLTAFQTSTGRQLSYEQALNEVQAGNIAGVNVFKGKTEGCICAGTQTETRRIIWIICRCSDRRNGPAIDHRQAVRGSAACRCCVC